jgi:carbamate kinase
VTIAIACGGGGIPVVNEGGGFIGVEAVIDKDLAAERLASVVGADRLVILTDVNGVYLNYGKTDQKLLVHPSIEDLEEYVRQGQFAKGSMEPKVRAVIRFIRNGGKLALIAHLRDIHLALEGKAGTRVGSA